MTEKLMMLFTFLSSAEDGNGTPPRSSAAFSRAEAHVLNGKAGSICGGSLNPDDEGADADDK